MIRITHLQEDLNNIGASITVKHVNKSNCSFTYNDLNEQTREMIRDWYHDDFEKLHFNKYP